MADSQDLPQLDARTKALFDSLVAGSENLFANISGVIDRTPMSPVVNSASVELKEERKTTTALRKQLEIERDAGDELRAHVNMLRAQLAEKEANAAEITQMLHAASEETSRVMAELTDTKQKHAAVVLEIVALEEAQDEEKMRLNAELNDAQLKLEELKDTQLKLESSLKTVPIQAPAAHPAKDVTKNNANKGNRKKGDRQIAEKLRVAAEAEARLKEDVSRLEKSLEQQDVITTNLEKVAEETQVYAADLKKKLSKAEARAEAAEKEKEMLAAALEATKQSLTDVKSELAAQEQMVVEVGAAVEAGKKREAEMTVLLREAADAERAMEDELATTKTTLAEVQETLASQETELERAREEAAKAKAAGAVAATEAEERRLVTEVTRLEIMLAQQNTFVTQQGKLAQASKAEATSLRKQLYDATREKMKLQSSLDSTQEILAQVQLTLEEQKNAAIEIRQAAAVSAANSEAMAEVAEASMEEAEELRRQLTELVAVTDHKTVLEDEVERQLREAAEEKAQLTTSLEATQARLEEVEEALGVQERLLESVAAASDARKVREEEMAQLLKDATEEKIRLAADTAHLEASLKQQTSVAENLGKMATGSKAAAKDLMKQMGAKVLEGERAWELVAELEAQLADQVNYAEVLQVQLAEVQAEGNRREEELARTQQLADQLNATQRTSAELSKELEKSRRSSGDAIAQRQLVELQLRAAEEKITKMSAAKEQSELSQELSDRKKDGTIRKLEAEVTELNGVVEELKTELGEVEAKLELERAGSLAQAKRNAMAMMQSYDVTQMMQRSKDAASMAEAMAASVSNPWDSPEVEDYGEMETAAVGSSTNAMEGEWLQAYDSSREIHYWYNNITLEVVWELPEGARVHQSVLGGDDDLPKHFEGPSGLNSR